MGRTGFQKNRQPDASSVDEALKALHDGDLNGMRILYAECAPSVYAFALSILKNTQDAEDALHDCFVRIWENADSYRSRGKTMAWVLTVARNLCYSQLREHARRGEIIYDRKLKEDLSVANVYLTIDELARFLLMSWLSSLLNICSMPESPKFLELAAPIISRALSP